MIRLTAFLSILCATLIGCTIPPADNRGAAIYGKYCASCHGTSGRGDGPLAAEFGGTPADLTLLRQRNDGTFPTEAVMAQIYGYPGRHQFGGMPNFGRVLEGPIADWVTPTGAKISTPQALIDLTVYLEGIQQ